MSKCLTAVVVERPDPVSRTSGTVNGVMCDFVVEGLGDKTPGNLDRVLRSDQNFTQVIKKV